MWTEHILNPLIIKSIFKDEIPSLKQIKMQRMNLDFGVDLLCRLYFDLKDFPISVPTKWLQRKCNTLQFHLSLTNSTFTTLSMQGGATIGDLEINFINQQFEFEFKNSDGKVHFIGSAKWIDVSEISAYTNQL